jgi:hypothetical protein
MALPVMIVPISDLRPSSANRWFMSRGREQRLEQDNRPLHGCFLGYEEFGFIFVDANDSPAEQRFTIGHETGHFLLDHYIPRRRAVERFGLGIKEVMDGKRRPTIVESFKSVLNGIPIGQHVNLMERKPGGMNAIDLYASEHRADRIALALLAPPDVVLQEMRTQNAGAITHALTVELLTSKYGLPQAVSQDYATLLLARAGVQPSPYDKLVRA